jgi:hypothetical protein
MTTKPAAESHDALEPLEAHHKAYLMAKKINATRPMQLDLLFPEIIDREKLRHIPNDIARSSLFAVAPRGSERPLYKNRIIYSVDSQVNITYNGEELRAADDELVWMQLIKYAERHPAGQRFSFTLSDLLRDLGWHSNKTYYDTARAAIQRLSTGNLWINNRRAYGTSGIIYLLHGTTGNNDEIGKETAYTTAIDPKSILLFAGHRFTSHQWLPYRALTPTARRLADYANSHRNPFPLQIEKFRELCGSKCGTLYKWRQQVRSACKELLDAQFADVAYVDNNDMIIYKRKRTTFLPEDNSEPEALDEDNDTASA